MNKDCGLNNESQKCKKCKFITYSLGLLRMHEKKIHNVKHPSDKIIDGFKLDDIKYCEVLNAMYEGDELKKKMCAKFDFKTHSLGVLRIHESKFH